MAAILIKITSSIKFYIQRNCLLNEKPDCLIYIIQLNFCHIIYEFPKNCILQLPADYLCNDFKGQSSENTEQSFSLCLSLQITNKMATE